MQTIIDGYTVDLDPGGPDDGGGCWISIKIRHLTYTASASALEDTGKLEAMDLYGEYTHEVRPSTIDKILEWESKNA